MTEKSLPDTLTDLIGSQNIKVMRADPGHRVVTAVVTATGAEILNMQKPQKIESYEPRNKSSFLMFTMFEIEGCSYVVNLEQLSRALGGPDKMNAALANAPSLTKRSTPLLGGVESSIAVATR